MDLITHTIVGTATYRVITQQYLALDDPLLIAITVGSAIPDIDIISQLFGDVSYCKYHRGATHSIIGILFLSLITGACLSGLYGTSFLPLFLFSFLGCITHIFLDTLNSYGAQVFWPFTKKRTTFNLLVFVEPFMVSLLLAIVLFHSLIDSPKAILLFMLVIMYFAFRYFSKFMLKRMLKLRFPHKSFNKSVIVPAFASIFHWDYILESDSEVILGRTTLLLKNFQVKKRLQKEKETKIIKKALMTKVGKLFSDFTPHFYIKHEKSKGKHLVRFIDLRYLVKEGFVNSAEVKISKEGNITEAFFQPYSENRKIPIK